MTRGSLWLPVLRVQCPRVILWSIITHGRVKTIAPTVKRLDEIPEEIQKRIKDSILKRRF
ncbi:MAG: hypothetical protein KatS3mg087_1553 [Patescibacteria group bacterium]|nr:MAG: hypothetical protein KatS3mg087_1553 [Patescibacteria group bacterium]